MLLFCIHAIDNRYIRDFISTVYVKINLSLSYIIHPLLFIFSCFVHSVYLGRQQKMNRLYYAGIINFLCVYRLNLT